MRAPRPSWPKGELDRGLSLVQTSAVSEQVVDQRRQALQAANAAILQAEGNAEEAAQLNIEFTHVRCMAGQPSIFSSASAISCKAATAAPPRSCTSIVSMDPIYVYFDMDEATYLRNNRLWFEGKRPSSRDTPNPVQVALTGETKAVP